MTTTRTDSATGTVTREINDGRHVITQVSRPNGEWWNIAIRDAR
jgi:hypothetical protein